MRLAVFFIVYLVGVQAMAQEQIQSSHFQFLKSKCEARGEDSPDSSPQSPPLDVDDPGTPGCNRWEINVLTDGDFTKGEKHLEIPLLDINYGIGDNLQLKYEVPMQKTQNEESSVTAVGPAKAGVKYMFYEVEETDTQVAVYPQVEIQAEGNALILPLLFSTKVADLKTGDLMFTGNLGYSSPVNSDVPGTVLVAGGLGAPILKRVSLMAELSAEEGVAKNSEDIREELVKVNVGLVGALTKNLFLYGSLGESVVSSDHLSHTYALAGFRLLTSGLY